MDKIEARILQAHHELGEYPLYELTAEQVAEHLDIDRAVIVELSSQLVSVGFLGGFLDHGARHYLREPGQRAAARLHNSYDSASSRVEQELSRDDTYHSLSQLRARIQVDPLVLDSVLEDLLDAGLVSRMGPNYDPSVQSTIRLRLRHPS